MRPALILAVIVIGTPGFSPYVFCAADPIANIDPDGNLIFFVNGFHYGDGGSAEYWAGVDREFINLTNDHNAMYIDGSMGGVAATLVSLLNEDVLCYSTNLDAPSRIEAGHNCGVRMSAEVKSCLDKGEKLSFVTHSMGAAFTKGLIQGLVSVLGNVVVDNTNWEIDIAPYQTSEQCAVEGVTTELLQHKDDRIAKAGDMKGAKQFASKDLGTTLWSPLKAHYITSFSDEIESFLRSFFKYIQENKQSENNK